MLLLWGRLLRWRLLLPVPLRLLRWLVVVVVRVPLLLPVPLFLMLRLRRPVRVLRRRSAVLLGELVLLLPLV